MSIDDYDMGLIIRDPIGYANKLTLIDLERLILILKDYYYNDDPLVPDLIYDQLEDVLRERSPKSKALATGAPVRDGEKVVLPYPMASQNKAKMGSGTVESWLKKYSGNSFLVSHKIDGMSMMYYKPKGILSPVKMMTRGNGEKGTNVSQILKWIDMGKIKIPTSVNKDQLAIRGELIMTKETWNRKYASSNPSVRNFVAGAVNKSNKHPEEGDLADIQFVAYQLIYPEMKPSEQFETLKSWGFHVAPYTLVGKDKLSDAVLNKQLDLARQRGPYQIDGLVISVDDSPESPDLENPKKSIAYKNQTDEVAQTKVIEVIWKGSKKARIKPTVVIEPVFLSGGNLSRATAHYAKYVLDNKIGPGALVTIVRSGDVIPYILSVDRPAARADMPDFDYEWTENGLDIYVTQDTDEIMEARLVYLAKALEIEFMGPGMVKKLVSSGFKTPVELIKLNLAQLKSTGVGDKMADKIWASMSLRLYQDGVGLAQLMDGTSIFGVGIGRKKIQLVLDHFPNLIDEFEKIKTDDDEAQEELVGKMIAIKGIERKSAEKILLGLPDFLEFLDQIDHIKIKEFDDSTSSASSVSSGPSFPKLKDLRVVFTGVRDKELETTISSNGGNVADGVSKTHRNQVVVAKDPSVISNKVKTALELGVPVMTLDDFRDTYLD